MILNKEVCLLAQEKGFNLTTGDFWGSDNEIYSFDNYGFVDNEEGIDLESNAYTDSQVIEFIERNNYYIATKPCLKNSELFHFCEVFSINSSRTEINSFENVGEYKTRKEALEACLLVVLKLI